MINFEFDYEIILNAINKKRNIKYNGMDIELEYNSNDEDLIITIKRYTLGLDLSSSLIFTNNDFFNKKLSDKFIGFTDKEMILNNRIYRKLSGISYPFLYKLMYYILNKSLRYTDLVKKLKVDDKITYEHMRSIARLINKNN